MNQNVVDAKKKQAEAVQALLKLSQQVADARGVPDCFRTSLFHITEDLVITAAGGEEELNKTDAEKMQQDFCKRVVLAIKSQLQGSPTGAVDYPITWHNTKITEKILTSLKIQKFTIQYVLYREKEESKTAKVVETENEATHLRVLF